MKDYYEIYGKVENQLPSVTRDEVAGFASSRQRYIWMVALPDVEVLQIAWIFLIAASSFSVLASAFVICSILSRVETRKKSVNIAVVFLAIPDLLFSIVCLVICYLSLQNGRIVSKEICDLQQFFTIWGFSSSIWMNFVCMYVGYEVLRNSLRSQVSTNYVVTIPMVIFRAIIVYTASIFLSVWAFIPVVPLVSVPVGGVGCVPAAYNAESEIFFWFVVATLLFVLPMVSSLCLYFFKVRSLLLKCQTISKRHSFQNHRNRRVELKASQEIMKFFTRIICIFVFMWTPTALLIWGLGFETLPLYFAGLFGAVLSHFQPTVSACIYLSKPDIWKSATILMEKVPCFPSYHLEEIEATERLNEMGTVNRSSVKPTKQFSQSDIQDTSISIQDTSTSIQDTSTSIQDTSTSTGIVPV